MKGQVERMARYSVTWPISRKRCVRARIYEVRACVWDLHLCLQSRLCFQFCVAVSFWYVLHINLPPGVELLALNIQPSLRSILML